MVSSASGASGSLSSAGMSVPHALLMATVLLLLPGLLHLVHAVMELCQGDALGKLAAILLQVVEAAIEIFKTVQHRRIATGVGRRKLLGVLLFLSERIEAQMQRQHLSGQVLLGHRLPP